MQSYTLFKNTPIQINLSGLDTTAKTLAKFADIVHLEPADDIGGIQVLVYSSKNSTAETDPIQQSVGQGETWRSFNVQNRIWVHQNPGKDRYLCDLGSDLLSNLPQQMKWDLIATAINTVLALLSDRLLLIHSALITDGDNGCLLTGPSGVGKSTAASRAPLPWYAPADDTVVAVSTPEGYMLYPLPTWSQLDSDPRAFRPADLNMPYRLSRVYFLEQSTRDAVEAIPSTDAIGRLFRNSYVLYLMNNGYFRNEDRLRSKTDVLMHVTRILSQTPCEVLKVSKEGRFWEQFPNG